MKKLYEFNALLECAVVIAADSEEAACKEVATYDRAWFETGELIGVRDVDLIGVKEISDQDAECLGDLTHVIV